MEYFSEMSNMVYCTSSLSQQISLFLTSFFIAEKHIFSVFLPGEWEIFIKYSVCEYIPYYTVKLYIVQYMSYNKNEYYKHNKTILINILNPTYPGCCAEMMHTFKKSYFKIIVLG